MNSIDFYDSLSSLPSYYSWDVTQSNTITCEGTRPPVKGLNFNPVTALAYRLTGDMYGTNKRETLKAGKALGLTRQFTTHVYNATTSVSNRGNAQVVRGKIRSALEI
tara:strand:+ start:342 stop:662 length:321 start_codon:yes stop_codon:yes gene_type:complete